MIGVCGTEHVWHTLTAEKMVTVRNITVLNTLEVRDRETNSRLQLRVFGHWGKTALCYPTFALNYGTHHYLLTLTTARSSTSVSNWTNFLTQSDWRTH